MNQLVATFSDSVDSLTLTLKVNVIVDTAAPVIALSGNSSVNIYENSSYTDLGATATDNVDGNLTSSIIASSTVNAATVGTYAVTYNVTDSAGNPATQVTRTVKVLAVPATAQVLEANTVVNASTPEILVGGNSSASSIVTIPSNVTNATVNISALATSTATQTIANLGGAMTINASTAIGSVKVEIPAGIQITAGISNWSGVINVPQVKLNSSVTVTPDSGNSASVSSVIEVGYGDTKLTFDKAVRILIAGQAGKYVGYSRGGTFTAITDVCSADT